MRKRQPAALDLRAIFEAAHEERTKDTPLWRSSILTALCEDDWHKPPSPGERYLWHASSLAKCPRELMLKRANLATDGIRIESRNTFMIGHLYHAMVQCGMRALPRYQPVATEVGGVHSTLNLAARMDVLYQFEGAPVPVEVKTEAAYASTARRKDQREEEAPSPVKAAHRIQVCAATMVLEDRFQLPDIETAWIIYVNKNSGEVDQQPIEITPELRLTVKTRLRVLDEMWERFAYDATLPDRLPDEEKKARSGKPYMAPHWNCRPRNQTESGEITDARGLYCEARFTCMSLPPAKPATLKVAS